MRIHRVLPLLVVGALATPAAAPTAPTATMLQGIVGPAFNISLQDASGARVTKLDPGEFTINVDDRSDEHNFFLAGPGVGRGTAVEFIGKDSWNVNLVDGTYTFFCSPHSSTMRGSFVVGNPPAPAVVPRVDGAVTATRITLARKTLKPGTYNLRVRDTSARENFHLIGPGVNRKTGIAFRGTVTWKVKLAAGKYTFRSDRTKRLRGTLTVR